MTINFDHEYHVAAEAIEATRTVPMTSQVPQEQSPAGYAGWRRDLFEPETSVESVMRWGRELGRRHGAGPTSLAAAREWAQRRLDARS